MTMTHNVSIVIEQDTDGYYAYCPELDGCQTQGDTAEDVLANIHEAIELYLETLLEHGQDRAGRRGATVGFRL